MGKQDGFLTIDRKDAEYRPVKDRIKDFDAVEGMLPPEEVRIQSDRCMDCGIPFCSMYGCPLGNRIPDYSDLIGKGRWKEALDLLESTNNFPEITGRICPALCEASCTLSVDFGANTCEEIELAIAEMGWRQGWVVPDIAPVKTGKRVAVIGSGPAGLAAAQQLCRKGHEVVVFEKSDRIGGLMMYGIPNFKLEKDVIERRLGQMRAEGVTFETEVEVGNDLSAHYILSKFDAVAITTGTPLARDLPIKGRENKGIYLALEYLTQQTKMVLGDTVAPEDYIDAKDKNVLVIGGGDTGSDCVGTSIRRGAKSVTQIELLPKPPESRVATNPWPEWPFILRTSSSHKEGVERLWSIGSKEFLGKDGNVKQLSAVKLEWEGRQFKEIPGSEFILEADLVLLSMGFVPFKDSPLVKEFGLNVDERGNIAVDKEYKTSVEKIFAAGDATTGASLVVRAIDHGRRCAEHVDAFLSR